MPPFIQNVTCPTCSYQHPYLPPHHPLHPSSTIHPLVPPLHPVPRMTMDRRVHSLEILVKDLSTKIVDLNSKLAAGEHGTVKVAPVEKNCLNTVMVTQQTEDNLVGEQGIANKAELNEKLDLEVSPTEDIITLQDDAAPKKTPEKSKTGGWHFFNLKIWAASKAEEPDMKTDPVEKNGLDRVMITHQTEDDLSTKIVNFIFEVFEQGQIKANNRLLNLENKFDVVETLQNEILKFNNLEGEIKATVGQPVARLESSTDAKLKEPLAKLQKMEKVAERVEKHTEDIKGINGDLVTRIANITERVSQLEMNALNQTVHGNDKGTKEKDRQTEVATRMPITNLRPRADQCFYPHAETKKIPHEE